MYLADPLLVVGKESMDSTERHGPVGLAQQLGSQQLADGVAELLLAAVNLHSYTILDTNIKLTKNKYFYINKFTLKIIKFDSINTKSKPIHVRKADSKVMPILGDISLYII
jgi:hypothetical protein